MGGPAKSRRSRLALPMLPYYGTRTSLVALFASAAACGARSDLATSDGGDSRDAAAVEPPRDAGVPEAPGGRCDGLQSLGPPVVVFGAPAARYESPGVVDRLGALDVFAFRVGATAANAYVARRVRVAGGAVAVEGDEVIVGPNARAVGAAASDGARLGFCWPDPDLSAPTRFAIYSGADYRAETIATIGHGAGDFCTNLYPFHGHWWAAWSERATHFGETVVAELANDGQLLAAPLQVSSLGAVAPHRDGFTLARRDATASGMKVLFWSKDGVKSVDAPTGSFAPDSTWLVSSPFAPDAVELGWYSPRGKAGIVRVAQDGSVASSTTVDVGPNFRGGPVLASFVGEIAVAVGRPASGSGGEILLFLRDAAGVLRGHTLVPTASPTSPRLIAHGATLLVVWSEDFGAAGGSRVMIQPFGC